MNKILSSEVDVILPFRESSLYNQFFGMYVFKNDKIKL